MFRILSSAFTAAALRGRKDSALGFRAFAGSTGTNVSLSHESSRGYRNWTARSMRLFPVRIFALRTQPSLPTINFSMMPMISVSIGGFDDHHLTFSYGSPRPTRLQPMLFT